jgi:PAS domain S-box-containing protein
VSTAALDKPEFYQALLDQATDLVAVLDADGNFRYSSPSCWRILGFSPDVLIGANAFTFIHPDDLQAVLAAFARALATSGEPITATFRFRHADKSWRVLETTGTNRLTDPVVHGIVINSRDVTDRVQAEADRNALRVREQESLAALLQMAEALVLLDNEAATEESVVSGTDAVAQHLVDLTRRALGCRRVTISALDHPTGPVRPVAFVGLTPEEEQTWRSGAPGTGLRDHITLAERNLLWSEGIVVLDASASPERALPFAAQTVLCALLRVGPRIVGVLSLDHGATPHYYAAEELALARAVASLAALVLERDRLLLERADAQAKELAMRETNRRMDAFLALASHELKTPLTTAGGNVQIAARRLESVIEGDNGQLANVMLLLARALRGIDRINMLVDDLLDISRIQADQLQPRHERYDLTVVVRDAVDEQRDLDPTRELSLTLPAEGIPTLGDPVRIGQVVLNYLTNALKYSPPEQPIEIGVQANGTQARVWVCDLGPGLAPTDQERVWERFHRVEGIMHQSGSRVGLGLGLYISKTIIEQHGGQVGVTSAPGEGATFWFTIPLVPHTPDRVS